MVVLYLVISDIVHRQLRWCIDTTNIFALILLAPNDNYSGRTTPLNSKCYILYIYSTNICTE